VEQKLTPVEIVFRLIGPPEAVGRILEMHEKSPYWWRRPSNNRSAGDLPSTQVQRALLTYAREHSIPVIESPPLARALHATAEVGAYIPTKYYHAVAEIIGYVMRLRNRTAKT